MGDQNVDLIPHIAELRQARTKAEKNRNRWQERLDEIDADLAAFERVLERVGVEYPDEAETARGLKNAVMAAALIDFEGREYTPSDVLDAVRSQFPSAKRTYVSRILIELLDGEAISRRTKGRGRQESVYYTEGSDESEAGSQEDERPAAPVASIRRAGPGR